MKSIIKFFALLLLLMIGQNSFAQQEKKIYYDKNWKVVSNESKAEYYRLVTFDANQKPIKTRDYFITGELQWEGTMTYIDESDNSKDISNGLCTWYWKNGNKQRQSTMINDKPDGLTTYYTEKGQVKSEIEYKVGILNGKYIDYYENGKVKYKAEYKDGKIVDQWALDCDEFDKCQKIFSERFITDSDENGWGEADKENYTSEIIPGKGLLMRNKAGNKGFSQWIHLPIDISNNFSIETVMEFKGGSENTGQGLIYGFKDWNNYYYFDISANGQYLIGGYTDGINIQFAKWTPSRNINLGKKRNLIKVNKVGDKVYFSINSQIVESADFYSFKGNNVGFTIPSGDKEVLFERLVVRQDIGVSNASSGSSANSEWKASASGFLIDPKGYIVTNYHVVDEANTIQVELTVGGQKSSYKAKVISVDKQNDLAVIKIDDSSYKQVPKLLYNFKLGISDVGTNVFCLGYPMSNIMGEEVKFTDGKISAKTGYQGTITTYQISVPVQHGNSGCPLFDYDGNLIGVVSSGITEADNVGYAIKSGYLNSLLEVLPEAVTMPSDISLAPKPLTDKIKVLSEYVVLIKIK